MRLRVTFLLVLLAGISCGFALAAPAGATSSCAKKVLQDWLDNSRIDGVYPLRCYQQAIDAIPSDIRPYSNAADAIEQALLAAGGRVPAVHRGGARKNPEPLAIAPVSTASSPSAVPIPLLVLGGISLALLAAGGAGYVSRRRRGDGGPGENDAS